MFYDILRGWKHYLEHGVKPGKPAGPAAAAKRGQRGSKQRPTFALEDNFGAEINALITLQMNPINMAHFAELFQVMFLPHTSPLTRRDRHWSSDRDRTHHFFGASKRCPVLI